MCNSKIPCTFMIIAGVFALLALYVGLSEPNPEGFSIKVLFFHATLVVQTVIPVLATGALLKYLTNEH